MGAIEWLKLQIAKHGPTGAIRTKGLSSAKLSDIGVDCYIGSGLTVTPLGGTTHGKTLLELGDRVAVGPNVTFLCSSHPEESSLAQKYGRLAPIRVEDDVWIGADVTILGGVEIGAESIVAAGAVVTKDIPERTIIGGVPAEKLKDVP